MSVAEHATLGSTAKNSSRLRACATAISLCVALVVSYACAPKEKFAAGDTGGAVAVDTDDFGQPFPVDTTLGRRVVSLVPAATELIFAMGRGDRLVGRTTWDEFPDSAKLVPNMGNGIQPNVEVVLAAKPTLVVLYASTSNRTAADAFKLAGVRTIALRVDRIADFERVAHKLGVVLNANQRASNVVDSVKATLDSVRRVMADVKRPTVVWPMYDAPIMVVGSGSFVAELIDIAGGTNSFADLSQPSPQVTLEEIVKRNPDFMMTSPASAQRLAGTAKWQALRAVRDKNILLVDTLLTGRPTVTLGMAAVSLAKLLHPDRAARLP